MATCDSCGDSFTRDPNPGFGRYTCLKCTPGLKVIQCVICHDIVLSERKRSTCTTECKMEAGRRKDAIRTGREVGPRYMCEECRVIGNEKTIDSHLKWSPTHEGKKRIA